MLCPSCHEQALSAFTLGLVAAHLCRNCEGLLLSSSALRLLTPNAANPDQEAPVATVLAAAIASLAVFSPEIVALALTSYEQSPKMQHPDKE
jgi:hypothetical protein